MGKDPQEYITCYECNGDTTPRSECCGAEIDTDYMICSKCREHSEVSVCEVCEGEGEIHPDNDEREIDPDFQRDQERDY